MLAVDPAKVSAVDPGDPPGHLPQPRPNGTGGELIATPTLVDLVGDDRPEIVVGAQEQYSDRLPRCRASACGWQHTALRDQPRRHSAGGRDRSPAHRDEQAYLPGWPVALPMVLTSVLPSIGDASRSRLLPVTSTVTANPRWSRARSAVSCSVSRPTVDRPSARRSACRSGSTGLGAVGPGSNSTDTGALISAFGGPALGRIGGSGLDVASPTSGPDGRSTRCSPTTRTATRT